MAPRFFNSNIPRRGVLAGTALLALQLANAALDQDLNDFPTADNSTVVPMAALPQARNPYASQDHLGLGAILGAAIAGILLSVTLVVGLILCCKKFCRPSLDDDSRLAQACFIITCVVCHALPCCCRSHRDDDRNQQLRLMSYGTSDNTQSL